MTELGEDELHRNTESVRQSEVKPHPQLEDSVLTISLTTSFFFSLAFEDWSKDKQ